MELPNDIILRPRFKFEIDSPNEDLLKKFEASKNKQSNFIVSIIDEHVFIKFPKSEQHFWSPQLHLEINKKDNKSATVHGLFGPNPSVWTLFIFFHFIVAGLFIAFGIWAYTNFTLGNSYAIQLFSTLLMVLIWIVLYFGGRMGKSKGQPEMQKLHRFMIATLSSNY